MIVRGPEYALEDLKDNLASPAAINDAMIFLETLNGKPTPRLTDNLLDFVIHESDGFDPEIHYSNNRGRHWQTMRKSFKEDELAKFGITEESCETSSDKAAMLRTMLIATVIQSLEQKYIMADATKYKIELVAFDNASKKMSEAQEQHYSNLIMKIRAPFTKQDQRFADKLDELINIVDSTISARQHYFKSGALSDCLQEFVALLQTSPIPEKLKLTVSNTVEEVRSIRNGLTHDESKFIIESINAFITKPNEENRRTLEQLSTLLTTRNTTNNESVTAISSNLFSLSLISVKSAPSSVLYGSKGKSSNDTAPTNISPKTPKMD